jgi:hypothetical protein
MNTNKSKFIIEPFGFCGVVATIQERLFGQNDEPSSKELPKALVKYLNKLRYRAFTMNYYRYFADNIDQIIDGEKANSDEPNDPIHHLGSDHAYIMGISSNIKAADIIKKEYSAIYPDNKMYIEAEKGWCYVDAASRKEAKQFLLWMNKKYFQPWVNANLDGWDDFAKWYDGLTDKEQELIDNY